MHKFLEAYRPIIGSKKLDELYENTEPLVGKHIVQVNSTLYGGGVAELLGSLAIYFNDLGIKCGWRVIKGTEDFFKLTKELHHALQGDRSVKLTREEKKLHLNQNEYNSIYTHFGVHDAVIIHDYQPLPLIEFYPKKKYSGKYQPWIWRCHIDLSDPNPEIIDYIKQFIKKYDMTVFHREEYKVKVNKIPYKIMLPSIDALSSKNKELSLEETEKILKRYNIPQDKPIIAQVSRFERWKDPLGVVEAFRLIRKEVDCRLLLLGSFVIDDPGAKSIYLKLLEKTKKDPDIIVSIQGADPILVNAVQRASEVIIQKSIREGFGLTVSEALYKGTPVVAGNVGGIPLQIRHGWDGYLVDPKKSEECAKYVTKLLKDKEMRKEMGENGRKYVIENFLMTRHLNDWINLLKEVLL